MEFITLIVVIVMFASALAVLLLEDFLSALAAFSVVSLALSVLFVLAGAPDVAMTEAAIGSGLSSLLFALALRKLGLWHSGK